MTISIRRMSLGSGYRYLIDSIARGDGAADRSSPLTRYYAESGTPPGRFLGAGLAGVNGGRGLVEGSECTEEMLFNMLGQCADPVTGEALGRAAKDAAVAGFDLTFSAPKSISAAWAVADAGTQSLIYQAHQEAIRRTIAYAEQHTFFSRSGRHGVVQEQVKGVIAAGFDHWDSRAGDPQLHTHVVVQNRAQSLDGTWRTLDSRGLFKQVVALSELHQGILQDLLTQSLGWGWDARRRRHSSVPRWEATGVSDELMAEYSRRSRQINEAKDQYVERFITAYGRRPTNVEILRLRQRATLATRDAKHHHSLHEQTQQWRERARAYVGQDTVGWVASLAGRNDLPLLRSDDLHDDILTDLATSSVWTVSEKRATFTRANLLAEIHRQVQGIRFASPDERVTVGERTADLAVQQVLNLTAPQLHHVPARFRREGGGSKFRGTDTDMYTTSALLEAEDRLLAAGREVNAPRVAVGVVAAVAEANLPGKDYAMSTDQAVAVESIATSGRALDVLVGPAGTGKSTSMAGLRAMWERQHGPASVIALAPSAAAAEVLGDELGLDTENTAKWLTESRRQAERLAEITRLSQQLATLTGGAGAPGPALPAAQQRLRDRLGDLRAEHDRWSLKPGQLVIVDEASLAGTFALDDLVGQARDANAKVLLVGDWAQLTAVDAGGAFSMLVRDRDIAPELTDIRRFQNGWEKAASTRLRIGDESAIESYTEHDRITSGTRDEMLDALYQAWKDDVDDGLSSLMIAGDLETVTALNNRARADRMAAGIVAEQGLQVAGGGHAGVGDRVVTRENNRRLSTGRRWVKNGDQWTVTATNDDGSMTVKRARGVGEVVLPAEYVCAHVELGYASTAHRAQGASVDATHVMVSSTTTREVLYVGATRGRGSNRLYVDTFYDPDYETSHGPVRAQTVEQVLTGVLHNVGADVAAHTMLAAQQEDAQSLVRLSEEYLTIAQVAQAERWSALVEASGLTRDQVAEVVESEAYGPLVAALRSAESRGLDVGAAFPMLVQGRRLDDAGDIAAVLHGRVDRWTEASSASRRTRDRSVVGLIARPQHIADEDLARALDERATAMQRRAAELVQRALDGQERWIAALGQPPSDPLLFAEWAREACTVAAYRELHDQHYVSVESARTATEAGDARTALAAMERARALAERQSTEAGSTTTQATVEQIGVQR
jgi:conjugative relaxase-like TrwC/TraI family protein